MIQPVTLALIATRFSAKESPAFEKISFYNEKFGYNSTCLEYFFRFLTLERKKE